VDLAAIAFAAACGAVVEAVTEHIDNLVLPPLVAGALAVAMSGRGR
jgi:hypothetical protein